MILRRVALFLALLFGVGATQFPAFVVQYQQALGGAIGELAAIMAAFDARSAAQGLTETAGIDRLRGNSDPLARQEGDEKRDIAIRLEKLREAQTAFRTEGPVARLGTVVTYYDGRIADDAWKNFEPAVPASAEAFVLGLLGFLIGGGAVHVAGRPFRKRRGKPLRTSEQTA